MQYGLWQIQKYLQQYRELVSKIVSKKFKESEKSKKLKNFKNSKTSKTQKTQKCVWAFRLSSQILNTRFYKNWKVRFLRVAQGLDYKARGDPFWIQKDQTVCVGESENLKKFQKLKSTFFRERSEGIGL